MKEFLATHFPVILKLVFISLHKKQFSSREHRKPFSDENYAVSHRLRIMEINYLEDH